MSREWWRDAVLYQIYPRSFADSNGDGVGDLPGIIDRLDYLQDLGVDGIWLSPHYPSPQVDVGYDVADYTGVEPEYGTLDDFRTLLAEAHRRRIRVLIDLVVNHSSDRHPWFVESRSSRNNPRRDWYVWHPGRNGGPPNNWLSTFGGPAWTRDDGTGEWYYHFFFAEQPDLNWHNPEVRAAMYDAVRFWLDMGVDGFRLDAIGTVFEDPTLADHDSPLGEADLLRMRLEGPAGRPHDDKRIAAAFLRLFGRQIDQPGVHEVFRELRGVIDEYDDRLLLGETSRIEYQGTGDDELHLVFNFPLLGTDRLTPEWIRANQRLRLGSLPGDAWPCNTLGNHDTPRMTGRFGDGEHDAALAKVHTALVLTLKGTPVLYNGDEVGMTDFLLQDPALFRDGISTWAYRTAIALLGMAPGDAAAGAARLGRDKCRTPMQWAPAPNAGFTPPGAVPWLPVNPNFADGVNVADQERDPGSLLEFTRRVLTTRRRLRPLVAGEYREADGGAADHIAYVRSFDGEEVLVALNTTAASVAARVAVSRQLTVALSSHRAPGERLHPQEVRLAPFEVLVATVG